MKPTIARLILPTLFLGLAGNSSSDDKTLIYKSVDTDGTTIFTDQPAPDATLVTPAPLNIVDQSAAAVSPRKRPRPADPATIDAVAIVSPAHQETFIDPQSALWVTYEVSPGSTLPVGLSARVLVDGTVLSTGNGNRLPIDIPERGTHTVQVQIVDAAGSVQTESVIIDIHVRHHIAGSAN